jgi:hypothetical protein
VPRILVLLFAVAMMTTAAVQVGHASPDVAMDVGPVVDDDGDPGTPTTVELVVVEVRARGSSVVDVPRPPAHGRAHVSLVFRPPRVFASR